jgi:hypothetical protein
LLIPILAVLLATGLLAYGIRVRATDASAGQKVNWIVWMNWINLAAWLYWISAINITDLGEFLMSAGITGYLAIALGCSRVRASAGCRSSYLSVGDGAVAEFVAGKLSRSYSNAASWGKRALSFLSVSFWSAGVSPPVEAPTRSSALSERTWCTALSRGSTGA